MQNFIIGFLLLLAFLHSILGVFSKDKNESNVNRILSSVYAVGFWVCLFIESGK